MQVKLRINNLILIASVLILIVIAAMSDYTLKFMDYVFSVIAIGLPLTFCIERRKNSTAFLIGLIWTYFNYSIVFSRYLYNVEEYAEFYENCTSEIMSLGIALVAFFTMCLFLAFEAFPKEHISKNDDMYARNPNIIISLVCLAFVAVCASTIDMSAIGTGRASISSLYEYAVLGFIFSYYYAADNKRMRMLITVIGILYAIQGLVCGERITAMQIIIVIFIYCFSDKIGYKMVMAVSAIGIVLMVGIGSARGLLLEGISFENVIKSLVGDRLFTFNGMDLGYYCSMTFLMIVNKFTIWERLSYFLKWLVSIFLGFSSVEGSSLGEISRQYFVHYNGGIFPSFFYFYGGWLCVIVVCSVTCGILYRIIKTVYQKKLNNLEKCDHKQNDSYYLKGLFVVIVATFPRWYSYNPQMFFRQILIYSVLYLLTTLVNSLFSNNAA